MYSEKVTEDFVLPSEMWCQAYFNQRLILTVDQWLCLSKLHGTVLGKTASLRSKRSRSRSMLSPHFRAIRMRKTPLSGPNFARFVRERLLRRLQDGYTSVIVKRQNGFDSGKYFWLLL